MARYRKIDPRIWNDEKFRKLSDNAKLVFFMLLTHPSMTALGAMRATLPGLAAEMSWGPEAFREAFREASAKGMAEHDEVACLVALPNFLKYNAPESPNVVKAWAGAVDLLPECPLKTLVLQRAKAYAEALQEGFAKAFREAFPKGIAIQEQEQEPEQEQEKNSSSSLRSDASAPLALTPPGQPADIKARRAERIQQIAEEARAAYNRILAKPAGLLPACTVLNKPRLKAVEKALPTARLICAQQYSNERITPGFWEDYFTEASLDDFHAGRKKGGPGHEGWKPDFEFLLREEVMAKLFDRAASEDAA